MKIIVCVRRVPDTATKVKIASDGKTIDPSGVEYAINPYEEYAVEEAARLKEKHGGEATMIMLTPSDAPTLIVKTLALGLDKAIHLKVEQLPPDPLVTAKALAAEIKNHPFDILLFGKKGVDDEQQQVGPMVAELLDIPCITQVVKIEISNGKCIAQREVEGGQQVVEASLPVALTAEKDLNVPRYASLKDLLAARKKPIEIKEPTLTGPSMEIAELKYPQERKVGRIVGKGVEAIPELVRLLREEAQVI